MVVEWRQATAWEAREGLDAMERRAGLRSYWSADAIHDFPSQFQRRREAFREQL
jgi:hypothetical protein